MTNYHNIVTSALNATQNSMAFQCGNDRLDSYLKKQARQDIKRRINRVFLASLANESAAILGYYTLSTLSIELNHLPEEARRKLPRHPVPGAIIDRLAVSQEAQGHGVGKILLSDGIKRTLVVSHQIAIYAMVVDAIDEQALSFYWHYGFSALDTNKKLYSPLISLWYQRQRRDGRRILLSQRKNDGHQTY